MSDATVKLDRLLKSFSGDVFSRNRGNGYADYYAGAHINRNGQLVLLLTDQTDATIKEVTDRIGGGDFIVAPAKFSANQLNKTLRDIDQELFSAQENLDPADRYALTWGIEDAENKIIIWVRDLPEMRDKFAGPLFRSEMIELRQAVGENKPQATDIQAGDEVCAPFLSVITAVGTYGYRAKGEDGIGIVVSAHLADEVGTPVYHGGTMNADKLIGTASKSLLTGVDAAFVPVQNNEYEPTNTIPEIGALSVKNYTVEASGIEIRIFGSVSGLQSGTTISTNTTVSSTTASGKAILLTNCVTSDYSSASGDSGCIVFNEDLLTVGTHFGSLASGRKAVCQAIYINELLGIERY